MASSSSATGPITFSGQSTFSSSFQQVLQRAVAIASLPMQETQAHLNTLQAQQSDLTTVGSTFTTLQNAIQTIASSAGGSVSASSSDPAVVTAAAQSSTLPGAYSLQVLNVGSSTSTISSAGSPPVQDPTSTNISTSLSFTLSVNGVDTTISPAGHSLNALALAINDANAGVSATIVNMGSNSSPDYRLALTSTELGADTIQLNDGTNNLLTTVQTGADAQYSVDGGATVLNSTSDQVTLAPGLTANLVSGSPGENVTITVAANEGNLSTALNGFVTAYNAAVTAVAKETGQNGGALAGQSLVYSLQSILGQISEFVTTTGSVRNLSDLGLTLNSDGTLSFDSTQFNTLGSAGIQEFLGGPTTGGFLQLASNAINSVADTTNGMLADEYNLLTTQVTADTNKLADQQARVNLIQTNLQQQLSAADAAIAVLQEQNSYYTNLFQTENANHFAGLY